MYKKGLNQCFYSRSSPHRLLPLMLLRLIKYLSAAVQNVEENVDCTVFKGLTLEEIFYSSLLHKFMRQCILYSLDAIFGYSWKSDDGALRRSPSSRKKFTIK